MAARSPLRLVTNLPILPPIPEAYLHRHGRGNYQGLIDPGMIFAWEPDLPYARELIIVVAITKALPPIVVEHGRGTAFISQGDDDVIWTSRVDDLSKKTWNYFSQFREAVVATRLKPQKR
jgi:hypothetical protein